MFVVVCFWFRNCEVNTFKTFDKAYEYMKKDFLECLKEYDRTMDNTGKIFHSDGHEDCLSFISNMRAEIYNERIKDNLTWQIEEIKL